VRAISAEGFWRLAALRANPQHLRLPDGIDTADILRTEGPRALAERLATSTHFASTFIYRVINERLDGSSMRPSESGCAETSLASLAHCRLSNGWSTSSR